MKNLGKKTAITAAFSLAIYLILFLFLDRPIDLWVHRHFQNDWVPSLGRDISFLAGGATVQLVIAFCLLLILVSDCGLRQRSTRFLLYVCISAAIAIVVGDGFKYLLGRYRPVMLFDHDLYGLHLLSTKWELNSTPSGHTLRAFSVLTALSMLYRRYTIVFITLALLIGVSRVAVTAHYPSDVLFGAFIGTFTALWTFKHFPFQAGDVGDGPEALPSRSFLKLTGR